MEPKEYLYQYRDICARIKEIDEAIENIEEAIASISIDYSGMPHGSGIGDKTGRQAIKLADLKAEYVEERRESLLLKVRIERTIHQVKNTDCRAVLLDRYIKNMQWQEVADDLHFDISYVAGRLHDKALREIEQIINCQKNSNEEMC